MPERLYQSYKNDIVKVLQNKFSYKNVMEIPIIDKVVINMGVGEAVKDAKRIEIAQKELSSITGQFPIITKAKKANASFKLREGMSVGLKVTLRKSKMYEFIDRLINIALPRVRGFRGISNKSFDGKGNYSLGLKEQFIFPEIEYDNVSLPEPFSSAKLFLFSPRMEFTFSKKLYLASLIQYSNQSRNLSLNARLQWRFAPLSDLFLVYNDNYFTEERYHSIFIPRVKNRSINFKITYWLDY